MLGRFSVTTLLELLEAAPAANVAIVIPETGVRITYESLRRQVGAAADILAASGIRRGDRVALALPNGPAVIVGFLAASIAGTAAPLNPAYRYEEFCFYLEDTKARLLVLPPSGAEEARRARIEALEARIAETEQAIRDIESAMAVPGFYDDRAAAQTTIDRHQALMWKVGDLMHQWEELQSTPSLSSSTDV